MREQTRSRALPRPALCSLVHSQSRPSCRRRAPGCPAHGSAASAGHPRASRRLARRKRSAAKGWATVRADQQHCTRMGPNAPLSGTSLKPQTEPAYTRLFRLRGCSLPAPNRSPPPAPPRPPAAHRRTHSLTQVAHQRAVGVVHQQGLGLGAGGQAGLQGCVYIYIYVCVCVCVCGVGQQPQSGDAAAVDPRPARLQHRRCCI